MVRSVDGVPISTHVRSAGPSMLDMRSGTVTASLTIAISYKISGLHPMRINAESLRTWRTEYRPACHHCAQDFGGLFRSTGRFAAKTKQLRKTIAVTNKRTNGSTRQSGFPYTSGSIDVLLCHGTAARDYAPLRCLLRKSITALKRSITSCVQWQLTGRLSGDCARMYSTLFATKLEAAQRPHGFTRSSHSMAQYLPRLEHDVLGASLNTHRQQHPIGLTSQHSRCQARRMD